MVSDCYILETRSHFYARYLDGSVGGATWRGSLDCVRACTDHTSAPAGPLSPDPTRPIVDISLEDGSLLGYMPHRDDFERVNNCNKSQLVQPKTYIMSIFFHFYHFKILLHFPIFSSAHFGSEVPPKFLAFFNTFSYSN